MESKLKRNSEISKKEKEQDPVEISVEEESTTTMDILSPAEKLPAEMLDKIMMELSTGELFTCRLICRMWDSVAVSHLRKKKLNISFREMGHEWAKYSNKNGNFVKSTSSSSSSFSSSGDILTLKKLNTFLDNMKSTYPINPSKSFPVTHVSFESSGLSLQFGYTSDVKTFLHLHGQHLTGLKLESLLLDSISIEAEPIFLWEILETVAPNLNHLELSLTFDWTNTSQAELKQLILPRLKSLRINLQEYHSGFGLILKNILESAVNLEEFNIYDSFGKLTFNPTYIDTFVTTSKFHALSKYVSEAHVYQKNSNSEKVKLPGVFWIRCSGGNCPDYAVKADEEAGGNVLVARSELKGHGVIPGKFHTKYTTAYIPLNGREIELGSCQVLVARPGILRWIPSSHGQMVENSVVGGLNEKGENLYIGRAPKKTRYGRILTVVPGKIEPRKRMMFFPWGGIEHKNLEYSILVAVKKGENTDVGQKATVMIPIPKQNVSSVTNV